MNRSMNQRAASIESLQMDPWLQRVRHDLVKRALWPARDLRALLAEGGAATPADVAALRAGLFDLRAPDGAVCDAVTLLGHLRDLAPAEALVRLGPGLAAFEEAVAEAQRAALDLDASPRAKGKKAAAQEDVEALLAALFEVERRFGALHTT